MRHRRRRSDVCRCITSVLFSKLSQDPLHRFSLSLYQMIGICLTMNDSELFLRFLTARCHDNQFCGKIYRRSFGTAELQNVLHYRHSYSEIFSGSIVLTFCANLMKIGPVTPGDYEGRNCTFLDEITKIGISHRISQQLLNRSSPNFLRW